ncbi:MAG: TonB-dependent receptor plug domain-containing protein, partial [Bacteroidota bacterium]
MLIIFVGYCCNAQNTVFGVVEDDSGPLSFATVYVPTLEIGATTDVDGSFRIDDIPNGSYTLVISYTGYVSQTQQLLLEGGEQGFNFLLAKGTSLDEIVVSGTLRPVSKLKSPVPVEVFNKTFFRMNPTPSVFESLQNVNGVRPQLNCNICNTGDIHVNGLEGPYTFVLIDGMPIVSGLSTVYGLTGIPQSLIERVEIVKGPASTLYGSEAVGGIINVITKKPANAPETSVES